MVNGRLLSHDSPRAANELNELRPELLSTPSVAGATLNMLPVASVVDDDASEAVCLRISAGGLAHKHT